MVNSVIKMNVRSRIKGKKGEIRRIKEKLREENEYIYY